jgi:hypothetical protein
MQVRQSYSVSPQTSFATPPCSFCLNGEGPKKKQRYTYAIVHSAYQNNKAQLLSFVEGVEGYTNGAGIVRPAANTTILTSSISSIVVSSRQKNSSSQEPLHDIVLLGDNGRLHCYSGDLGTHRWTKALTDAICSPDAIKVQGTDIFEFVIETDVSAALKGLLKNREDVTAGLHYGESASSKGSTVKMMIFAVSRSAVPTEFGKSRRTAHLFLVREQAPSLAASQSGSIQQVLSWSLSTTRDSAPPAGSDVMPSYSLHVSSATLYCKLSGEVYVYDLSSVTPRKYPPFNFPDQSFVSMLPLASKLLMVTSEKSCCVFDSHFGSLQGAISLVSEQESSLARKKRKRSGTQNSVAPISFWDYFNDLGLVIGLKDNVSFGLVYRPPSRTQKEKRLGQGLLVDSIGKGGPISVKKQLPEWTLLRRGGRIQCSRLGDHEDWSSVRCKLDDLAEQGNITAFDQLFMSAVGMPLDERSKKRIEGSNGQGCSTEADLEGQQSQKPAEGMLPNSGWHLSRDFDGRFGRIYRQRNRSMALYVLGKIFSKSVVEGPQNGLGDALEDKTSVQMLPPNAFHWLVENGYISVETIEQSLRQTGVFTSQHQSLNATDFISLIVSADPEMRLLHGVLSQPAVLSLAEIVASLKLLLKSLNNTPEPQVNGFLEDDNSGLKRDEKDVMEQLRREEQAALADIDNALSALDQDLSTKSQALRKALMQLHAFPYQQITQALRAELAHHDIIFLIQILRIELADGGWTSRYVDAGPDSSNMGPPADRAIELVSNLLSCAIDAIGTGGWLSGRISFAEGDSEQEVLVALRGEVSAALEGIHEAAFMKGLLDDFLRFESRHSRASIAAAKASRYRRKLKKKEQLEEPVNDIHLTGDQRLLPLGLKVQEGIEQTKAGRAGEIRQKTNREIAAEMSKKVGSYSFETIRI